MGTVQSADKAVPADQNPKGSTIIAVGATYGKHNNSNPEPCKGFNNISIMQSAVERVLIDKNQ